MSKLLIFLICYLFATVIRAQPIKFAHITDTHIGNNSAKEDLEQTITDINGLSVIDFVVITGDITEFGSDEELQTAHEILLKLNKPWYIIPGNHDSKWSESGCNSFSRIFGKECFSFEKGGYLFIGTSSGPNMRMGPGLVPREQIIYLDSVLKNIKNPNQPIVFINHYPLDNSLANWYKIVDLLKSHNIQLSLLGHGHSNKLFNFEGIPGIMGRSSLRGNKKYGGYNIATITNDSIFYVERTPVLKKEKQWCKIPLVNYHFSSDTTRYPRPDYSINKKYPQVKIIWEFEDKSDIGTALSCYGKMAVYANTSGEIIAINTKNGQTIWKFQTKGKIYSTPIINKNYVVCPSTDNNIYCLNRSDGKLMWVFKTNKSIVASPVIAENTVYTGSSDGIFRAVNLQDGQLRWQYDSLKNFVETRPLVYQKGIFFGSWGNTFYALDRSNGKLLWKRVKYSNRMLSPAAVYPVAAHNKIFIVAPDRHLTALDVNNGKEIWDSGKPTCRESIGISGDGELIYIKNMTEGNITALYSRPDKREIAWECKANLGYDISPTPLIEINNLIFVTTGEGFICAINKQNQELAWKYKVSDAIINCICPIEKNKILATTLDGKVICLKYN